jgi:hypothetical protein
MPRANRAFEVSEEFGLTSGTPGDQRLFARKLSAFDWPLRAALRARYIEFEPVSAAVFWIPVAGMGRPGAVAGRFGDDGDRDNQNWGHRGSSGSGTWPARSIVIVA